MRRLLGVVVAVAAALVFSSPLAQAAEPTVEHVIIDSAGFDEFLSDACGFPVLFFESGRVTIRTFFEGDKRVARVQTINLVTTVTANGNDFVLRDTGVEVTSVTPEGLILSVSGQFPFQFKGTFKINLTTGEAVLFPHHLTGEDVVKVCASLAG
jgi:hypothetical protein